MKQFIYDARHAGLSEWPAGTLRLDGIDVTENPHEADVFVVPGHIRLFEKSAGVLDLDKLSALPYFRGNEHLHAFFDVSDNFTKPVNLPILFIKCDARASMLAHDTGTISVAWPVEDFAECVDVPEGGFKYDVSFQGWLSSVARENSVQSIRSDASLKSDIAGYSDFCGYIYDTDEGKRRRKEFRRSMRESRIALCPESIPGVLPYRFFEAMSAGRIPLLIGSDYVLPFASEIPYQDFTITVETADAHKANQAVHAFLRTNTDDSIIEKGRLARAMWLRWLDSRQWPSLMAYAVKKQLNAMVSA